MSHGTTRAGAAVRPEPAPSPPTRAARSRQRRSRALAPLVATCAVVVALGGCGPAAKPPAPVRSSTPPPLITGIPVEVAPPPRVLGSGVPLDAPILEVRAPAPPPPKLARGKGRNDAKLAEGDAALARGEFAVAEAAYAAARKLALRDPAPLVGIVRARLTLKDVPTAYGMGEGNPHLVWARLQLDDAIKLDPAFAPAQLELGRAWLVEGKPDLALKALDKAVAHAPNDAEVHTSRGVALVALGKLSESIEALQKGASLAPNDADRHSNLGVALLAAGRVDDAVSAFERAVTLAPDDSHIRNDLGAAYLMAGSLQKALPHLERAVRLHPRLGRHRSHLCYACMVAGDLPNAVAICQEAVAVEPGYFEGWLNLGTAHAKSGALAEARKAYDEAGKLRPDSPRLPPLLEELAEIEKSTTPPK
jgi:tetratricopeptide (TPR) repeat protein